MAFSSGCGWPDAVKLRAVWPTFAQQLQWSHEHNSSYDACTLYWSACGSLLCSRRAIFILTSFSKGQNQWHATCWGAKLAFRGNSLSFRRAALLPQLHSVLGYHCWPFGWLICRLQLRALPHCWLHGYGWC